MGTRRAGLLPLALLALLLRCALAAAQGCPAQCERRPPPRSKRRHRRLVPLQLLRRLHNRQPSGWLTSDAVIAAAEITLAQHAAGLYGTVLEIGVHHGRFFAYLAGMAAQGEALVAIDVFGAQHLNADGSGWAPSNRTADRLVLAFGDTCARLGLRLGAVPRRRAPRQDRERWVWGWQTLSSEASLGKLCRETAPIRIASVDGSHLHDVVLGDLEFAACHAAPGAVIIVDDFANRHWLGVASAVSAFCHLPSAASLVPFAVTRNKVLLTGPRFAGRYAAALQRSRLLADRGIVARRRESSLCGLPVLALEPAPAAAGTPLPGAALDSAALADPLLAEPAARLGGLPGWKAVRFRSDAHLARGGGAASEVCPQQCARSSSSSSSSRRPRSLRQGARRAPPPPGAALPRDTALVVGVLARAQTARGIQGSLGVYGESRPGPLLALAAAAAAPGEQLFTADRAASPRVAFWEPDAAAAGGWLRSGGAEGGLCTAALAPPRFVALALPGGAHADTQAALERCACAVGRGGVVLVEGFLRADRLGVTSAVCDFLLRSPQRALLAPLALLGDALVLAPPRWRPFYWKLLMRMELAVHPECTTGDCMPRVIDWHYRKGGNGTFAGDDVIPFMTPAQERLTHDSKHELQRDPLADLFARLASAAADPDPDPGSASP